MNEPNETSTHTVEGGRGCMTTKHPPAEQTYTREGGRKKNHQTKIKSNTQNIPSPSHLAPPPPQTPTYQQESSPLKNAHPRPRLIYPKPTSTLPQPPRNTLTASQTDKCLGGGVVLHTPQRAHRIFRKKLLFTFQLTRRRLCNLSAPHLFAG